MISSKLGLVNATQLREITGYTQDGHMMNALEKQGIACFYGRNGPWTTVDLINMAGMVKLGIPVNVCERADKEDEEGVL